MRVKKSNKILKGLTIILFITIFITIYSFLSSSLGSVKYSDIKYSIYSSIDKGYRFNTLEPLNAQTVLLNNDYESILTYTSNNFYTSSTKFSTTDPRIIAMKKFLRDYNSPMESSASTFITVADEVGLDWRLIASISGVESAFGRLIPGKTYNGWGWRGGPGGSYSEFSSWDNAIEHITKRLAIGYGTDLTPFEIEPTYCPPCYANPRHEWANGVTRFMNELKYYHDNLENIR